MHRVRAAVKYTSKQGTHRRAEPPSTWGSVSIRTHANRRHPPVPQAVDLSPSSPFPSAAAGRKDPRRFCFRPRRPAFRWPPGSRATSLPPCRKLACGVAHPAPYHQDECGKCASSFAAPSTPTRPGKVEGEARVSSTDRPRRTPCLLTSGRR